MAGFLERAIDGVVAMVSPKAALSRRGYRNALGVQADGVAQLAALQKRAYGGGDRSRLSSDWRGNGRSGNANLAQSLWSLRARCRQMERDNPYIKSAVHNLAVDLTGLDMRATHTNPRVAKKAQAAWKKFKKTLKFVVREKVIVREVIGGGDCLVVWRAKGKLPNQRIQIIPAEQIDTTKTEVLQNGNVVIMGVEYDADLEPVAYWIFVEHPGDLVGTVTWRSERVEAAYVDHIYEELWAGQARGVPWFYASVATFDEIAQLETALRVKERVAACLAVVRIPGTEMSDGDTSFGQQSREQDGRMIEELGPGAIVNARPGDQIQIVNPASSSASGSTLRSELMKGSAGIGVPHHIVTGDVSQANFSSLRADLVPYRARREDWAYTVFIPKFHECAFRRCMELEAVKTGDQRFLEVEGEESLPPLEWIDPLKDIMALKEKLRIFPGMLPEAMAKLGLDWRVQVTTQAEVDQFVDLNKVVYDADARRTNGAGALQAAAGKDADAKDNEDLAVDERQRQFAVRISDALEERDAGALNAAFAEAAYALRSGDPAGPAMHAVLMALTD